MNHFLYRIDYTRKKGFHGNRFIEEISTLEKISWKDSSVSN